jgi:flagellar motility protein MotE (MotC chaperone)
LVKNINKVTNKIVKFNPDLILFLINEISLSNIEEDNNFNKNLNNSNSNMNIFKEIENLNFEIIYGIYENLLKEINSDNSENKQINDNLNNLEELLKKLNDNEKENIGKIIEINNKYQDSTSKGLNSDIQRTHEISVYEKKIDTVLEYIYV